MKKRGRPRKVDGTSEQLLLREYWRKAGKKYYENNKLVILEKAKLNKVKENENYTRSREVKR